jgi:hypothetical protein
VQQGGEVSNLGRYIESVVNDGVHRFGQRIRMRMTESGRLRPETWRDRWASTLSDAFWPRPHYRVTSVDTEQGVVTMDMVR